MAEWREKYLEGVPIDQIIPLLSLLGLSDTNFQEWIITKAALCRLSFAYINESDISPPGYSVPDIAIISRTEFQKTKGRPKTSQWCFWLLYIVKQGLQGFEKTVSSRFLSYFAAILLGRGCEYDLTPEKIRSNILWELRKEANRRAIEAGKLLLDKSIRQDLSEKQFKVYIKNYFEETLNSDTQMLPVIENGKINEDWLKKLLSVRKNILRKIAKNGPLGGQPPIVDITYHTRIFIDLPITPPPYYNTQKRDGLIHFSKGIDAPVPSSLFEQEKRNGGDISFNLTCNKDGGTTSISFPEHILDKKEPFIAALYSVPAWWFEWSEIFYQRV